jgi:hypothetical protein
MTAYDSTGEKTAGARQGQLSKGVVKIIKHHASVIAAMPDGEFFISSRLDDDGAAAGITHYPRLEQQKTMVLQRHGIIHCERRVNPDDDQQGHLVSIWNCDPACRERARNIISTRNTPIPACEHTGIRNIDGGGFTCTTDACDVEVSRDEVEL